jgi:plasmid stabilization system protein ParE
MTYRFLSPATQEIINAAEYYDSQVLGLGSDFLNELDAALQRILQFPEAWSVISTPFRHCSLRRFPYTIIYTLETSNDILVVSVFHQSRKPMTWENNLS